MVAGVEWSPTGIMTAWRRSLVTITATGLGDAQGRRTDADARKVHPDTGKAASLGRSGLRLSKVAEQWEREHGGIVIDNRVRRRQAARALRRFRRRADERLQTGPQRGDVPSEGRAARRRARRRPPARPRPAPAAARRTVARPRPTTSNRCRARRLGAGLRTGTADAHDAAADADRAVSAASATAPAQGGCVAGAGARHRRAPGPAAGDADTASSGAPGPASRPRSAGPSTGFAARLERVLGIRRRLSDAINTAMDAVLIARSAGAPAAQMDRCWARHKRARHRLDRYERSAEPIVRDHDAASRREARGHGNGNTSANASGRAGSASAPRLPAADSSPAGSPSRLRQPPHSAAPHPARRLRRPVRRLDPRPATSPRTRRRRPRPRRALERPPTGAAGRTGTGGSRGRPPLYFLSGRRHATTVTVASGDLTRPNPLQPTLSEAADVTRAPAPAHASPSHFRVHSVSVRRASGTPAETDGPRV